MKNPNDAVVKPVDIAVEFDLKKYYISFIIILDKQVHYDV